MPQSQGRSVSREGEQVLHRAFLQEPLEIVERNETLLSLGNVNSGAFLIREGIAYRSFDLPGNRPAILDLLIPGDIAGLENLSMRHRHQTVVSTGHVRGHRLGPKAVRGLLADPVVDRTVLRIVLEAASRMDRLTISLGRFDARQRVGAMVLDLYDRLRRRRLIRGMSFNLPLTQHEIANHLGLTLAHVNRTLRRMREDHMMIFDRGAVVLLDIERLRQLVDRRFSVLDGGCQAGLSDMAADD